MTIINAVSRRIRRKKREYIAQKKRLKQKRSLAQLDKILDGRKFTIADIGARDVAESDWQAIESIVDLVLFEADEAEAEKLKESVSERTKVVPCAIWSKQGVYPLYITRHPWLCSMLEPNPEILEGVVRFDRGLYDVLKQENVQAERLDNILPEHNIESIDFLKIDVQGGEGHILESLDNSIWDRLLGVMIEAYSSPIYKGATTIADTLGVLYEHDFEIFDLISHDKFFLSSSCGQQYKSIDLFGTRPRTGQHGRSMIFDLVLLRPRHWIIEREDGEILRKAVFLYAFLGFYGYSLDLVIRGARRGLITETEKQAFVNCVTSLHRSNLSFPQRIIEKYRAK